MSVQQAELADEELLDDCLAGDETAWPELRLRHGPPLVRFVLHLLHGQKDALRRAEEIAEEVLESLLVPTPARLRRFDPGLASFSTYLRILAVQAVHLEGRQNKGRRAREGALGARDPANTGADDAATGLLQEEFVASLPPREQAYCRQERLGQALPGGQVRFSAAQGRKLCQRIRNRIKRFCQKEADGEGEQKESGRKKVKGMSQKGPGAH